MMLVDCLGQAAMWLRPIDGGTVQSKLLGLLLLGVVLALSRLVSASWKQWGQLAGTVAAALWALLFVYAFSFCVLTFLT